MNAGATAERVYVALKMRITELGLRPGARLDVSELADELASSATPVREALHQLLGEGLVESRTGGGFFLPAWDEPGLRDCYAFCAELLRLALSRLDPIRMRPARLEIDGTDSANRVAALFEAIGKLSVNAEHASALERLGARLHSARVVEGQVLPDVDAEVTAFAAALEGGDARELRRRNAAYHHRRARAAAMIVRALYRTEPISRPDFRDIEPL